MSAYGELQHALSDKPTKKPFKPEEVSLQAYDDQNFQEVYFVADSFEIMKEQFRLHFMNFYCITAYIILITFQ